jgi:hypothetical protein
LIESSTPTRGDGEAFMSALRIAGIIGAVIAVVGVTASAGPPPLDAAPDLGFRVVFGVLACAGALPWSAGCFLGLLLIPQPAARSFFRGAWSGDTARHGEHAVSRRAREPVALAYEARKSSTKRYRTSPSAAA